MCGWLATLSVGCRRMARPGPVMEGEHTAPVALEAPARHRNVADSSPAAGGGTITTEVRKGRPMHHQSWPRTFAIVFTAVLTAAVGCDGSPDPVDGITSAL